ncbi:MAG: LytTR family DNA-binding domain-containing protein [Flavobacteriales bacterium]
MKIVIIEDEPLTAEDLCDTLKKVIPSAEILIVLPSIKKAVEYFKNNSERVDLIFSDIELQDGKSFEIFSNVKVNAPIVFCTAYDEYALEAFKNSAIDYVLKPFSKEDIENSLLKLSEIKSKFLSRGELFYSELEEQYNLSKRNFVVHFQGRLIPLKPKEIDFFYKENELTYVFTVGGRKYVVDRTMDAIELEMGRWFFRVNRQCIVNHEAIREVQHLFNRKLDLVMKRESDIKIEVSRNRVAEFMKWLSNP